VPDAATDHFRVVRLRSRRSWTPGAGHFRSVATDRFDDASPRLRAVDSALCGSRTLQCPGECDDAIVAGVQPASGTDSGFQLEPPCEYISSSS
jgi:hypothetical protein